MGNLHVDLQDHPRAGTALPLRVMTLVGDLDLASVPRLRSATDLALPADGTGGASDVVVDLASVEFIDSAGLGALLNTLRRTTKLGGRLALVGASEQAIRLFTMTGVNRVVSLHATLAEAIARGPGFGHSAAPRAALA
ncbi:anti-sigma B factor antagonist/stage II sporulation protein AA (anti-sigma F factor antagonist) [Quadrisphaera granulorum]|uniref:Anti-sigma factor antagonist n=2 Tax=Quadrisphaera granulorum TaxID=317664 RepID=A0A316A8F9_9ACTN|nr:anti-sigma B factor antagonist/stage II sporulation protein AA (anti-sigma F factor antagonist) [Quadrisphaera granulorum]SZE97046.1 anti-sigma B factor antagonist/stage II sporulation protein AA (anti-sigma F factor antagonist) [Quadrisphaera granulorum]